MAARLMRLDSMVSRNAWEGDGDRSRWHGGFVATRIAVAEAMGLGMPAWAAQAQERGDVERREEARLTGISNEYRRRTSMDSDRGWATQCCRIAPS